MYKTLRISFALKNTYRVNSILYSLKQIPIVKRILPEALYRVKGLKIFANILSFLWEAASAFIGKLLYFITMVCGIGILYRYVPAEQAFLHILLFLTLIGSYINTKLFNPSRDKYYALIMMRMDAREYTLVNYGYAVLKVIVGFIPFSVIFGTLRGVPVWFCAAIPFSVAGIKILAAAYSLYDYEKNGNVYNENNIGAPIWAVSGILLVLAYGLPAVGVALPAAASMVIMLSFIPAGLIGIRKIATFPYYREISRELLANVTNQMDAVKRASKMSAERTIQTDTSITSKKKGVEYLNELFIRRHQKILWKSTVKIAAVSLFIVCGILLVLRLSPGVRETTNELLMSWFSYFVFVMYAINRGTGFTRALFMNCDHSLLTYSFYKQPAFVLKLFQIRLREIIKINAVPALVIGAGLAAILYVSGGTDNPVNYGVLIVATLCMSIFFSIHYLTIYYLLQPYNAGTEMKSATYQIIMAGTYLACLAVIQVKMPIFVFGIACIVFCAVYSAVACILVYHFAPKTFRLRV